MNYLQVVQDFRRIPSGSVFNQRQQVLFLLGCLPALRLSETVGRRPLLLWSFALMVLPFLALGIAPQAPVALIIFWFCLYAVASGGPDILEWSYPNELFPTDIRATAMGVITAVSRIGAALGTFLLPLSLDHLGDGPTMLIIAGMTAVGFIVSYALAPENKGRSLSETSSI